MLQYSRVYFGLLFALQDLFGRSVDLIMVTALKNPYFIESINQSRTVVYDAAPVRAGEWNAGHARGRAPTLCRPLAARRMAF